MSAPGSTAAWWQSGVIYQVYPRSFADASGDGVGDLRGVIARLPYLAWLGVDAVWISPVYRSPMKDFGYDVADYCDVDPLFGDLPTFDELVAEAHALGLRVIMDFVPNHTSDQHPWFIEARRSRESAERSTYVWRDRPNNWLSVFGGSAWELDAATGQYYLHSFLKEQPDLNWREPKVVERMNDVLRFWLDRGVDGFRIDVAFYVMKDPEFRDNPPNPSDAPPFHRSLGAYDTQLHVFDKGHPDVHEVFKGWRRVLDGYEGDRMCIAEIHEFDWKVWASYYGAPGQLDELHMPFNFGLLATPWAGKAVRAHVDAIEAAVPAGAWPNYVMGNHDEPRLATRLGGEAQARAALVMLLALRGTPTLYYGDELAMTQVPIPAERVQDPWEGLTPGLALGRDGCRTPMPWRGDAPNAGFCAESARPWLPLGDDWRTRNVEAQKADPGSTLSLVRAMLALRRRTEALRAGAYRALAGDAIPDDCFAFVRDAGGERGRVIVAVSFADEPRTVRLEGAGDVLLSTHALSAGRRTGDVVELGPHEACVLSWRLS